MFIWEHDDGTVSWTGSFNQAEWDAYLAKRDGKAAASAPADPPAKKAAASSAKKTTSTKDGN